MKSDSNVLKQLASFVRNAEEIHAQWEQVFEKHNLQLGLAGFIVGPEPLFGDKGKTCKGYWDCDSFGCKKAQACTCTPCECSTSCTPQGRSNEDDALKALLKKFEELVHGILPDWDNILEERNIALHVCGYMVSAPSASWGRCPGWLANGHA